MNKLFLEELENAISECLTTIVEYDMMNYEDLNEEDITRLTHYEGRYKALKWTRDLYLRCIEDEETTND